MNSQFKFTSQTASTMNMLLNTGIQSLKRRSNHLLNQIPKRCINASALTITPSNDTSKIMPPKETLKFGTTFAPHMLSITFSDGQWSDPVIKPLENGSIPLASACLNYGMTCFEGMKAYRSLNGDDDLRLFRPERNMERLSRSMERISLPGHDFDHNELLQCISKLIDLDKDWVPSGLGYSLYLRPNVIAINENLGETIMDKIMLYVMTSPVGPYYSGGFKPVKLICETEYVRAVKGGTGDSKLGGNYAGPMKPSKIAAEKGYDQVLWLLNGEITEVGAMNIFFVFESENGKKEVVTPPLSRGDILPGVTRQSIIELASTWEDHDVVERNVTMDEVAAAVRAGTLVEAFGAGTAAVVTPIECISYKGEDLEIAATGNATQRAWDELMDIQYGIVDHPWSFKVAEHI